METMTQKSNYLPVKCIECGGNMYLFGVFTEQSNDEPIDEYWECDSCHKKHEISERVKELKIELDLMEEIYGDNFPEPSEQLDRWNKIYDEYEALFYPSTESK